MAVKGVAVQLPVQVPSAASQEATLSAFSIGRAVFTRGPSTVQEGDHY